MSDYESAPVRLQIARLIPWTNNDTSVVKVFNPDRDPYWANYLTHEINHPGDAFVKIRRCALEDHGESTTAEEMASRALWAFGIILRYNIDTNLMIDALPAVEGYFKQAKLNPEIYRLKIRVLGEDALWCITMGSKRSIVKRNGITWLSSSSWYGELTKVIFFNTKKSFDDLDLDILVDECGDKTPSQLKHTGRRLKR